MKRLLPILLFLLCAGCAPARFHHVAPGWMTPDEMNLCYGRAKAKEIRKTAARRENPLTDEIEYQIPK